MDGLLDPSTIHKLFFNFYCCTHMCIHIYIYICMYKCHLRTPFSVDYMHICLVLNTSWELHLQMRRLILHLPFFNSHSFHVALHLVVEPQEIHPIMLACKLLLCFCWTSLDDHPLWCPSYSFPDVYRGHYFKSDVLFSGSYNLFSPILWYYLKFRCRSCVVDK